MKKHPYRIIAGLWSLTTLMNLMRMWIVVHDPKLRPSFLDCILLTFNGLLVGLYGSRCWDEPVETDPAQPDLKQ
jgi:hypothetical protein